MGCLKLSILDEQYKKTELKVSYQQKELTVDFCDWNVRSSSLYAYCMNNPIKYIDPTGMENVIYLVDLQGEKKTIDPNKLVAQVNEYFKGLGLETRMALAPDGANFDPDKMDKTDSYAVLGSTAAVGNFVEKHDKNIYDTYGIGGLGYWGQTEKSSNTGGEDRDKTRVITLEASLIKETAERLKIPLLDFAAMEILHGAGHNVGFNHSDETFPVPRYGQNTNNCSIMCGSFNSDNYKARMGMGTNGTYIDVMSNTKHGFGTKKATAKYPGSKIIY